MFMGIMWATGTACTRVAMASLIYSWGATLLRVYAIMIILIVIGMGQI